MKLYLETTANARKAVQVLKDTDPAPSGFDGATDDIVTWDTYGVVALGRNDYTCKLRGWPWFRDHLALQAELQARVELVTGATFDTTTEADWDNLSAAEKEVAARWGVVPRWSADATPVDLHSEVLTVAEQGFWRQHYAACYQLSRELRWRSAQALAWVQLGQADYESLHDDLASLPSGTSIPLVLDLLTSDLLLRAPLDGYLLEGVLGSAESASGQVGIVDYLLGRAGTPYSGAGLPARAWTVSDALHDDSTTSVLGQAMRDILSYGRY